MRFLFVYQDSAREANELVDRLAVRDVRVITVRKNAIAPTREEMNVFFDEPGCVGALCGVNRKYKALVRDFVTLTYETKQFRIDDQILRTWLLPNPIQTVNHGLPSASFIEASNASPLILAPGALTGADALAEHRWEFASKSAKLLGRYSNDEAGLGALRSWKASYGVEFAVNGRVHFNYSIRWRDEEIQNRTEWHLKEGDNTTLESAARVYFERVGFKRGARIVVFRVGPHPAPGGHSVSFSLSDP